MSEVEEGENSFTADNAGVAGSAADEGHSADAEVEEGLATKTIKEENDYESVDEENFADTTTIAEQVTNTAEESDLILNGNGTEMEDMEIDQSLESVESLECVVRAVTDDLLDSVDSLESNELDSLETSDSNDKVNQNGRDENESSDQNSIFEDMDEGRLAAEENGTGSINELIIDESGTEEQDSLLNQNGETEPEEPVGQEEGDDGGNSAGTSLETEIPSEIAVPVSRSDQEDTEVVGENEIAGAGGCSVIKEDSTLPLPPQSSADAEPDFIDSLIGDVDETSWDHNQMSEDGLGWFNNVPEGEIVEEEEPMEFKPDLTSMESLTAMPSTSTQAYQNAISINNVVSLNAITSSLAESLSRSSSRLANNESNEIVQEEVAAITSNGFGEQQPEPGDPSDPTPEGLFYCAVCCSGFPNEESYAEHTLIHTDPSYQAKMRDGAEATSNNLLGMKVQRGVSKLQCKICGQKFLKKRSLQNHERSHKRNSQITDNSPENGLRCQTCHKRFYKLDLLEIHEQYNLCDDTKKKKQREISNRVRQNLRGENGHPAGNSSKANQDVGANSRRILAARRRKEPEPSTTSQAVKVWDGKDTTDQFSCRICSQVFRGVDSLRQHWIAEHLRVEDMTAQKIKTKNQKLRRGKRKLEPRSSQTNQSVSKEVTNSKSRPTTTTDATVYNYMCVVCHFKVATIEELTAHAKTHFKTGTDAVEPNKKSKQNARTRKLDKVKASASPATRGIGSKRTRSLSPEYGLPPPLSPQQAEVKNESRNSKIKPSTSSKGVAVKKGTNSPRKAGRSSRLSDLSKPRPESTPQNKLHTKQKKVNLLTRLGRSRREDKSKPESAPSDKDFLEKHLTTRTTIKLNAARSLKHSIYKPRSARLTTKLKSRPFLSKRLKNDKTKDKSPDSKRYPKRISISCEFCNRVFVNNRALTSHKMRAHQNEKQETSRSMRSVSKKPASEHDATVQPTPTNSDSHMKKPDKDKKKGDATTSNRKENNLHCEPCNKSFASNSALKSHLEKFHKQKNQASPTTNPSTKNSRSHHESPAELDTSRSERRRQRNAETSETNKNSEVMPDKNQLSTKGSDDLFSPIKLQKRTGKLHEKKKMPLKIGKTRLSLDFLKKKTAPSSTAAVRGSPTAVEVESRTSASPDKKSRLATDKKDRPLKRKLNLKKDMNTKDAEGTNGSSSDVRTVKVSDAIAIEAILSHKIPILQLDRVNHSSSQNKTATSKNEAGKMRGPKSQKRKRVVKEDSDDQGSEKKRTRRSQGVHDENGVSTPETQTPTSKNGRPSRRRGSEVTPPHNRDIDQKKVAADSGTRTSKSHAVIPESKSESLTAKPRPASRKKPAKQDRSRNVVGNPTGKRHSLNVEY